MFPLQTVTKYYIVVIWVLTPQPMIIETIAHRVISFRHNHSEEANMKPLANLANFSNYLQGDVPAIIVNYIY